MFFAYMENPYKSTFNLITNLATILAGIASFFMQIHVVDSSFGLGQVRFMAMFLFRKRRSECEYKYVFSCFLMLLGF